MTLAGYQRSVNNGPWVDLGFATSESFEDLDLLVVGDNTLRVRGYDTNGRKGRIRYGVSLPTSINAPEITGTLEVGETLTCSTGGWRWFGGPTLEYSYQWKLDGVNVGTDQNTYVPDEAGDVYCVVTATNSGIEPPDNATSADSNTVEVTEAISDFLDIGDGTGIDIGNTVELGI